MKLTIEPTREQMHILLHSLGLTCKDESYRNHYATDDDDPEIAPMVAAGWMFRGRMIPGGLRCFHVSEEGKALALAHRAATRPKLTRGQRRYRRWLGIADSYSSYTFKDFLTMPAFSEERKLL